MERPSGPSQAGRTLQAVVDSSRATGRGYVVLALSEEDADRERLTRLASAAVAAVERESGVDRAVASVATRDNGEPVGLVCAEVGPAVDPAALGNAALERVGGRAAAGAATGAGHPDLELEDAIVVALEGLDVALQSGSATAVHSELYDLVVGRARSGVRADEAVHALEDVSCATPARAEDDPFAVDLRAADEPGEPPVPARERAELVHEIESLRGRAEELRDEDRHARGLLERRIAKLARELETAEAEIDRLRDTYEGDRGRASVFRTVQGLDPDEPLAPIKKRLIDGVFRENEGA